MGIVFQSSGLTRKTPGRVMYKGIFRLQWPQSLKQSGTHPCKINQMHLLAPGHFSYRIRIITMCIQLPASLIKTAALNGCNNNAGILTTKLQGEFLVPVKIAVFARLAPYEIALCKIG